MKQAQISETIAQITTLLNRDLDDDLLVQSLAETLQQHIPSERISLGLHILNRWYFFQSGQLTIKSTFFSDRNQAFAESASCGVFIEAKPKIRRDILQERQYANDANLISEGMRSDLIIPIVLDNRFVAGTLNFTDSTPNIYTEQHLDTALSFVDVVAVLVKQLHARYEMQAVREITSAVQTSRKLRDILPLILNHIRGQGYDRVRIYLYDESDDVLVGTQQVGSDPSAPFRGLRRPIQEDTYSQRTFAARNAQIYQQGDFEFYHREQLHKVLGIPAYEWAELPLMVTEGGKDRIVGKIAIDNAHLKVPIDPKQLDRLMVYASQVAVAIHHVQLHQTLNDYLSDAKPTRIFTTTDVAKKLGLSDNAVRLLARKNDVGTRVGNHWTFTPADIEKMKHRTPRGRPRKESAH